MRVPGWGLTDPSLSPFPIRTPSYSTCHGWTSRAGVVPGPPGCRGGAAVRTRPGGGQGGRAGPCGATAARAGALDQLGTLLHYRNLDHRQPDGTFTGDPGAVEEELALVERALALRRELGDEAGIAESTFRVGLVHQLFTGR